MDTGKIDKLDQCIRDVDHEVVHGLLKPLFAIREAEWDTAVPALQQECDAAMKRLGDSVRLLELIRRKTIKARDTANQMCDLHNEMGVQITPGTLSEHIRAIVDDYLAQGKETIDTTDVIEGLKARDTMLNVKNPAAVVSSILGRDERLKGMGMGLFGRKGPDTTS